MLGGAPEVSMKLRRNTPVVLLLVLLSATALKIAAKLENCPGKRGLRRRSRHGRNQFRQRSRAKADLNRQIRCRSWSRRDGPCHQRLYINYYLAQKQYDKAFEYGDKIFAIDPGNFQNAVNMVRSRI